MNEKQRRVVLLGGAGWLAVMIFCFALGQRKSQSAPCNKACSCRVLTFWQVTSGQFGAFQLGGGPKKQTFDTAVANVNTSNGCGGNVVNDGTVKYDKWQIPHWTQQCNPPGVPQTLFELTVTKDQLGIIDGTLQPNVQHTKCQ